jgi:hypothetical protein
MSGSTSIFCGHFPVGVRQSVKINKNFTGVAPEITGPPLFLLTPELYANSVATYVKPSTTVEAADKAGLFTFGEIAVSVTEILCDCGAATELKVAIADPDGTHEVVVHDYMGAAGLRISYDPAIVILPYHQLKLYTRNNAAVKTITVYVMRAGKRV